MGVIDRHRCTGKTMWDCWTGMNDSLHCAGVIVLDFIRRCFAKICTHPSLGRPMVPVVPTPPCTVCVTASLVSTLSQSPVIRAVDIIRAVTSNMSEAPYTWLETRVFHVRNHGFDTLQVQPQLQQHLLGQFSIQETPSRLSPNCQRQLREWTKASV